MYNLIEKIRYLVKTNILLTHGVCGIHMKLCNLTNVSNEIKINHLEMIDHDYNVTL
jgi:hypothetical protein